jgi:two-component system, NtrC family, response regulator HydG
MKKRILIIDDDTDMCILLSRYFTQNNYETVVADSARAGIEKFKEQKFDIVLTDYYLGEEKDGRDVLKEVKEQDPSTIVLIITAYPDIKKAIELTTSGAYEYVEKPIIPSQILAIINKAVSNSNPPPQESLSPSSSEVSRFPEARKLR